MITSACASVAQNLPEMPIETPFEIHSSFTADVLLVEVSGEVDMSTSPRLEEVVAATPDQAKRVVVDLSGVTFLDSSGLNALVRGQRQLSGARDRLQARQSGRTGRPARLRDRAPDRLAERGRLGRGRPGLDSQPASRGTPSPCRSRHPFRPTTRSRLLRHRTRACRIRCPIPARPTRCPIPAPVPGPGSRPSSRRSRARAVAGLPRAGLVAAATTRKRPREAEDHRLRPARIARPVRAALSTSVAPPPRGRAGARACARPRSRAVRRAPAAGAPPARPPASPAGGGCSA